MADRTKTVAMVVGKLLSDNVFREAFQADSKTTLKHAGITLPTADVVKLKNMAAKVKDGLVRRPGAAAADDLHCNVASSVGVA